MDISQAVDSRISCRAFQDKQVPRAVIKELLEKAKRSPSGGNLQPWHVWVMDGERLATFKTDIAAKLADNPFGEGTEYDIYPKGLVDPYRARRGKCGEDMYKSINVARDDKMGRLTQFARNFELFGAPTALFFAIDRRMGMGQWSDLGMFIQTFMLLAREAGLHSCAQEAWAIWHKTISETVNMPDDLMLFCGMGVGYMDETAPINSLRTDRAPTEEIITFL